MKHCFQSFLHKCAFSKVFSIGLVGYTASFLSQLSESCLWQHKIYMQYQLFRKICMRSYSNIHFCENGGIGVGNERIVSLNS